MLQREQWIFLSKKGPGSEVKGQGQSCGIEGGENKNNSLPHNYC